MSMRRSLVFACMVTSWMSYNLQDHRQSIQVCHRLDLTFLKLRSQGNFCLNNFHALLGGEGFGHDGTEGCSSCLHVHKDDSLVPNAQGLVVQPRVLFARANSCLKMDSIVLLAASAPRDWRERIPHYQLVADAHIPGTVDVHLAEGHLRVSGVSIEHTSRRTSAICSPTASLDASIVGAAYSIAAHLYCN